MSPAAPEAEVQLIRALRNVVKMFCCSSLLDDVAPVSFCKGGEGRREECCGKEEEGALWEGCGEGGSVVGRREGVLWEGGGSIVGGRREEGGMWGGMERKGGSIFIAHFVTMKISLSIVHGKFLCRLHTLHTLATREYSTCVWCVCVCVCVCGLCGEKHIHFGCQAVDCI